MIPVRAYFDLLSDYLRPLRWKVTLLGVVLFGTIGLQLINPQLIKRFIDGALAGDGATDLILPKDNEKEFRELSPIVRKRLRMHLVETMDEVLALALLKE